MVGKERKMNREQILERLTAQGFHTTEISDVSYSFNYEKLTVLLSFEEDDESFLSLSLPYLYEVNEDNRPFALNIVNQVNSNMKYTKACLVGDDVWALYEVRISSEDVFEDLLMTGLQVLKATAGLFHFLIKGGQIDEFRETI